MSIVFMCHDSETAVSYRRALPDDGRVLVIEALLSEAIAKAEVLDEKGSEVFVGFGGMPLLLRQGGIQSPVVEIHLTSKDIAQALTEAKTLVSSDSSPIAIVGFSNMVKDINDLRPFFNLQLTYYTITSEKDALTTVSAAINAGAQLLLGTAIIKKIAKQHDFPVLQLRPGEASIRTAFEEAERIVYARRLEIQRSNELKAMLEYAYEGIIAVNSEGRITVFNPMAQTITGVRKQDALGSLVFETIPQICFKGVLHGGDANLGQFVDFGNYKIMMNQIPVWGQGKVIGSVATFQDITKIQSMEARIRREIHSKGHIAKFTFQDILGRSQTITETIDKASSYALTDSTVLIHGETGVGKELFAQSIHHASNRNGKPFVATNCAAMTESLLESELFGYVEGAFTGARRQGKPGLFELAHSGTIFLDEVSEIPLSLQGRLLRVLQEREVVRLGHDRVIPIDVRVLCATNRNIRRLVEEGKFRDDLYWRLNVLSLTIPPLRERQSDIPLLIESFLKSPSQIRPVNMRFTTDAISFLMRYPWPGNVRELRNFCERVLVRCPGGHLDESFVRLLCEQSTISLAGASPSDVQRIENAIDQAGGRLDRAAMILGIHRSTLWRRRRRLESKH